MQTITFEDDRVHDLFPITLGRPAYAMLCGSFRLVDWIERLDSAPQAVVRDYLNEIQAADYPGLKPPKAGSGNSPTMWINARLVPSHTTYQTLRTLRDRADPCVVRTETSICAAIVPQSAPPPPDDLGCATLDAYFRHIGLHDTPPLDADLPLIEYPHHLIRYNRETLEENLSYRLEHGEYEELADGVYAAAGARMGKYVVTDTRSGPILLESHAKVGPHAFLSGPAYLGSRTRVIEHAAIKDYVTIGHTAKIGGEVEASVIEAYTNKQHHGFLGHSYLGSWINLGAGTCNSDLKNTYGEVKMQYGDRRVATGMQFVGCIMGDYAKSAINTGIFTGKTVGACSMIYGFVTTNVPSFVNYARLFGQITELPPDVMIATQRRMFVRRKVTQRSCDQQLIRDMYALTRKERQLGGNPLSL